MHMIDDLPFKPIEQQAPSPFLGLMWRYAKSC